MTARITGASTVELSEPIRSGAQVIRVVNASARAREFKFQRMPAGLTALAFVAQPRESEPGIDQRQLLRLHRHAQEQDTRDVRRAAAA